MEFVALAHRDYLELTIAGEFNLAEGKAQVDELYRLCAQHALSRVLINAGDLSENVSVGSRFNMGEYLATSGTRPVRIAILTTRKVIEDSKALENTANNRGAQVMTTDRLDQAMKFLGLEIASHRETSNNPESP